MSRLARLVMVARLRWRQRVGAAAVGAVATLVLAACGEESGERTQGREGDADPGSGGAEVRDVFRRDCNTRVFGGPASRTTPDDLTVGAVTFQGAKHFASRRQRRYLSSGARGEGWRALKTVTTVEDGVRATVSVTAGDRSAFLLLYDPSKFKRVDRYRASDGDGVVQFGACPPPRPMQTGRSHAELNGGFLVKRPGCFHVRVVSEAEPEPITRVVNIAVGREGCR